MRHRLVSVLFALTACNQGSIEGAHVDASRPDARIVDTGVDAPVDARLDAPVDVDAATDAGSDGGADAGPPDPCETALFCETFEDYDVGALSDGQRFGPWQAAVGMGGSALGIDDTRAVSGSRALHAHVEVGERQGGRLYARGAHPLFEGGPTHLYGRMRMYLQPDGASVHWTYFGATGPAVASSPVAGRRATYLMSALGTENRHSFVYGLQSGDTGEPYRDCWRQGPERIADGRWSCVAFEMDSEARILRSWIDTTDAPTVMVEHTGSGCVGDVPGDTPWYGPSVSELYVGAWSFHPMNEDLDVWIDDLIVDTSPVPCD